MVSAAADAMATVVSSIAPLLKDSGFRKRRHSFNRQTEPGTVQVVHFQMGPHDPPGTTYFPPIRVNLYGKFTINLGVFVEDVHRQERMGDVPSWVNEYNCQFRKRVGHLLPEHADIWWPLDDPDTAANGARDALTRYGLPWLDSIRTRREIVDAYEENGRLYLGLPPAAPRIIAAVWQSLG